MAEPVDEAFDEEFDPGWEAAWEAELLRRSEAIKGGSDPGKPAEQVFAEMRKKYGGCPKDGG